MFAARIEGSAVEMDVQRIMCCFLPLLVASMASNTCQEGNSANGTCETVAMMQKPQLKTTPVRGGPVPQIECQGFKCERGVPVGGVHRGKKALAEGVPNSGFDVNFDGKKRKAFLPGAHVIDDTTVQYGINDKYYLMKSDTTDYSNPANFEKVKLAGKTMITEISLNGANCGCNVNFFLVSMPAGPPGQYHDHYCDANCVGGNCCAEFDINEMNDHALQITNHNCYGNPSKGSCDGDGHPMVRFGPPEYGPGSWHTIDTTKPFTFALQVQENIAGNNDPDNHLMVYVRLWQNGKTVMKQFGGVGNPVNSQWKNLADGMVLVVDYWQSQNLNWLDGVGCGYGKEYCSGHRADLSKMRIISNDLEKAEDCPGVGSCKCDWFKAKTMAYGDDATECWCRCGGCKATTLTPRCLWSGYKPKWT